MRLIFSLVSDWQVEKILDPIDINQQTCTKFVIETGWKYASDRLVYRGTRDGSKVDIWAEWTLPMHTPRKGAAYGSDPEPMDGYVSSLEYFTREVDLFDDGDEHAVEIPNSLFKPRCITYYDSATLRAYWKPSSSPYQPTFLPDLHTVRGFQILQLILSDLRQVNLKEPIRYLALYSRDLITTRRV